MDLNNLDIPETIDVHLEFPDPSIGLLYADDEKKAKPMIISLYSPAADEVIAFKNEAQKRLLAKMNRKGFRVFNNLDADEQNEQEIRRLVAFTADVKNVVFNGKEVTKKNIKELYSNPKLSWINDQISAKLGSWEDFLS